MLTNLALRPPRIALWRPGIAILAFLILVFGGHFAQAVIRDGGVDPANLGQGGWLYIITSATNKLGGTVPSVTDVDSMFAYLKSENFNYVIVKAGTSNQLWTGSGNVPIGSSSAQFTTNLCTRAHTAGLLIFGSNRSWGQDIPGESAVADYVYNCGADGYIHDAESEWESGNSWIGTNGPTLAWQLCSMIRSNWPNKFMAHNPYDTVYLHSSFPFKEFGYWCDTVMPQVYHHSASQGNAFAAIHWMDVHYKQLYSSFSNLAPSVINGQTVYWTNSLKPLALMRDVYNGGSGTPVYPDSDVRNFDDYLQADPNCMTIPGYKGSDYFRSELHSTGQWANMKAATVGDFAGIVNNIILDDNKGTRTGTWNLVRTISATTSTVTFSPSGGNSTGTDTNSFGTNYWYHAQGTGANNVTFTPTIVTSGNYDLYEWHPYRADASTNVPFIITYNGGAITNGMNQKTNVGDWSYVGRFNFAAGTSGTIKITDQVGGASTNTAIIDALKMVYVSAGSAPTAPSGLAASAASSSQINLTWTDNSSDETGFVVARSTTSGGPYTDITTAAANATSYNDTGLASSTTYYYVVRAINGQGSSVNSSQTSATTLTSATPPSITSQPQSQTLNPGANVTFTVTASGTAPLSYQWQLNASPISGATLSSYTRANVQSGDAGSYSVIVTNAGGSATSANAILSVNVPAAISSQPASQTVYAGSPVTFTVTATGTAPLSYQWRFNAGNISGATTSSLTKNNVQNVDAGSYSVVVTNVAGTVTSSTATLTVNPADAPAITTQPQSQTVIAGSSTSLSVVAGGTTPLSYQWYFNGSALSGATSTSISTNNIQTDRAGSYLVIVTNAFGSTTSSTATLTVNYSLSLSANGPGSASKSPDQTSYTPNSTVTLTATPSNNAVFVNWTGDESSTDNPLTVTMSSNKIVVANFANVGSVTDIILDNTNSEVTLSGIWQTGTGSTDKYNSDYYFASTASGGTSNVTYRPNIVTSGNYDVFVWYPQGSNRCTNAPWSIFFSTGSTNIAVNQTSNGGKWFQIGSALPFLTGTGGYVVVSNNSAQTGKVVMADAVKFAYSAVQGVPPVITSQPQNQTVVAGGTATFNVSVVGDPPAYQWRRNGINIPGAIASTYVLPDAQPGNAGTFSVVVTNSAGSATSSGAILTVHAPAAIATQPSSRTVTTGNSTTFTVTATGDAPLAYQWRFNGGSISGATNTAYSIASVQTSNAGSYSVIVTNAYGAATSSDATLTVNVPPSITAQPQSQSVVQANGVTFSVTATGTGPLTYQWRFNGGSIPGATASNFALANAQTTDAGSYSVIVTNVAGSVTSGDAVLTVNVPVTITAQPQGLAAIQGSNATFTVSAAGTAPFAYQWRLNTSAIAGATGSSYTRVNVQAADAGSYSVVVTNGYGAVTSANAILDVHVPPAITSQPQAQTVLQANSATFSVGATGTAPLSYQWRRNSAAIPGATGSSYAIPSAQGSDAGSYSVVVTNDAGAVTSSSAALVVQIPPLVTVPPDTQVAVEGSDVSFTVSADGTQPLSYQWKFNGADISGATDSSLTKTNVSPADAGTYSVVVTNVAGSDLSDEATLTVQVPPAISAQPQGGTINVGSDFTFTVAATGTPPIAYQWRFNGSDIPNATDSSYTRTNAQVADSGSYSVLVSNDIGQTNSALAVLVVGVAPSVVTEPVSRTNTLGTTATFSVVATGSAPLQYQWKKGASDLVNGGNVFGATSPQLTLTNVTLLDSASYSVVITNAAGAVTSDAATLAVVVKPGIVTQPLGRTNAIGSTTIFSVTASGGGLRYQWKKGLAVLTDGGTVSGATTPNLTIATLATNSSGTYSAVVTNLAGSTNSVAATLAVWAPPLITKQPLSRTNSAATTATFTVLTTGNAPLSYQWMKGADKLVNSTTVLGATTATLTLTTLTTANAGDYSVVVTNAVGSATSTSATLTVLNKPTILVQPLSQTNNQGTTVYFNVVAAGGNLNYQWKRGTNLVNGGNISGAQTDTLTVSSLVGKDGTNYSVVVSNLAGTVTSTTAKLLVITPPVVTKQPTNTGVLYGSTAVLRAFVTGTAPLTYHWQKGGNNLSDLSGKIVGTATTNLTILTANYSDVGSYSLVASNVLDTATSSSATLTIVPGVTISSPAAGASFATPQIDVLGTASDNGGGGGGLVRVVYQMNGGVWQAAGGTTNWSALVTLQPGTNVFGVKAVDAAGYESALLTRAFFLTVLKPITLQTNGLGSITGVTNGQLLAIGRNYSVTGTPLTGQVLSNWSGTLMSSNNPFVFMMQTGMVVAANFIPNPFISHTGIYNGLYFETDAVNHARSGFFTFTVTSSGTYSGSFYLAGTNRTMSGKLTVGGQGHFVYTGVPAVTIDFAIDFSETNSETVYGQVAGAGWVAPLNGDRAHFAYAPPAPQATNYTVSLQGFADGTAMPGGDGYANVTIKTNGLVSVTGHLPDDATFVTPAAYLSKNGDWPFYAALYGGKGSVLGWLTYDGTNTFSGNVSWIKTMTYGTNYPGGFTNELAGISSVEQTLASTTPLLSSTNAMVIFSQGNLANAITNFITLSNNIVKINPGQTNGLLLGFTLSTGQFSGSFINPSTSVRQTVRGIIMRQQDNGRGYFLAPQTGYFLVQPY